MRKRHTFLLTILGAENETASFCGRVKVIATGKTFNFTNMEELQHLIVDEMEELDALQGLVPFELTHDRGDSSGKAIR